MAKILSDVQALAILAELDNIPLRAIRNNKELFEAIAILGGLTEDAGTSFDQPEPTKWILSCSPSLMVSMVKAIRMITGLGLKEAKDYYDGVGGYRSENSNEGFIDITIYPSMSVIGTDLNNIQSSIGRGIVMREV